MSEQLYCRICEKNIGGLSWYDHIREHKAQFCRETGIDPVNYKKVPWETCVRRFNPSKARADPEPSRAPDVDPWDPGQALLSKFARKT